MAPKMAAETFEWSYVCNYQLKIDDLGVYPYVFGGKKHIEAIKMTLNHHIRCKSNMAPNMAANTIIGLFNCSLKFDDLSVYPQFSGVNEHKF